MRGKIKLIIFQNEGRDYGSMVQTPAVGERIVGVVLELALVWEEAPTVAGLQVLDARSRENLGGIGKVKTRYFTCPENSRECSLPGSS